MAFGNGSSSSGALGSDADVALNNPTTGQVLTYDAAVGKWKNAVASTGFVDPTTTKGDVIVHGTSTTRLGVGGDGQVLTASSVATTGLAWSTPASSPVTSVAGKTGIVTLVEADVTNLTTDLAGKAATIHSHAAADVTTGTLATARLGSGVASASTVLLGNQTWAFAPLVSVNAQTGSTYTLTLADAGSLVTMTNSSANTVTVPSNATTAFPVGSRIMIAQMGAGQVTIVAAGGVGVFADPGLKIATQYGAAELIQTAADVWLMVGRLSA